jgi:D-alanyl-D-alanine carboxypeptidase/D-alanyl-D-alanine-endopeptidase (penicillin-binding protein 4)
MNQPSDNYIAEMLIKGLGAQFGTAGSTAAGSAVIREALRPFGISPTIIDGSGLSRGDRASPRQVVKLLSELYELDQTEYGEEFIDSLPIAGQDGTLATRMRGGPARYRCRGKTGTLSNVSALSGYCEARSGDTYVYSILMNYVYPPGARRLQDAMLQAIAAQ